MQPEPVPTSAICSDELRRGGIRVGANAQSFEGDFDDVFGLGARDQYVGSDFKIQSPEFLMAGEVLRRDAAGSPRDEREISLARRRVEFLLGMRVDLRAVATKRVHQQQFGGERRRRRFRTFELRDGVGESGANVHCRLALKGSEG